RNGLRRARKSERVSSRSGTWSRRRPRLRRRCGATPRTCEPSVQGDLLVAAGRATDAIPYFDAALRANPKAKGVWSRKGNAHASLEQRPEAIRAYIQVVNLNPDDVDGYARVLALVPEDVEMSVRKGEAHARP